MFNPISQSSKIKDFQRFYEQILVFAKNDPDVLSADEEVHKAKVIHENFATFIGTLTGSSWLSESCDLTFLPETFMTWAYGFYLQKGSPYTKRISDE